MKFYYLDGHIPVIILHEDTNDFAIKMSSGELKFVEKNRVSEEPESFQGTLGEIKLPKPFSPTLGQFYYRINENLTKVIRLRYQDTEFERLRVKFGLCFKTETECQAYMDALEFANQHKPSNPAKE